MAGFPCEECDYYDFDEECEDYVCTMDLDMDEFERFLLSDHNGCPYFRVRDEYRIVRKQN